MKKKVLLILALLCAVVQGAWAADRNYEYPTKTKPSFYASYGGKSNVVVINTPAELAYITANFSGNSGYNDGKKWAELDYYLNADINMGTSYKWLPMGLESSEPLSYKGTFWGNSHTITYKSWYLNVEKQGLFSIIDEQGKVYDVNVVCDISSRNNWVGGITGENSGTIQNCTVTARIVNDDQDFMGGIVGENKYRGTVSGCRVSGTIVGTGSAAYIGGIAGKNDIYGTFNYGIISNCWSEADVTSAHYTVLDHASLGGICGSNLGKLEYCCMTGNVTNTGNNSGVGGIAGYNNKFIYDCTFYGSVVVNHVQDSKYIGENFTTEDVLYDTFNQSQYDKAQAAGKDLYCYAIKYPFIINAATNGLGTIRVSAGGEDDITRWRPGVTITVTKEPGTKIDGVSISDADRNTYSYNLTTNGFTFTMPKRDVDVVVFFDVPDWPTQGTGTEDDPYLITSEADWSGFAYNVVYGNSFSGKYVKLTEDISVTTMAGRDSSTPFEGIFDGGGHTLTFTKGSSENAYSEEYCAPFRCVKDATVKNLHVAGTITTSAKYAGGLVGHSLGDVTITNCVSSVTINSSVSGEGRHGGFVGALESYENHATISGCVFDGAFATTGGTTGCSGLIGYTWYSAPTICNSVMKPTSVAADMLVKTFADWYPPFEPTIINSYYVSTANLPANQGKQSHTITAGDAYTTIEAVTPVGNKYATYDVAGINAYLGYYASSPTDFVNGLACGNTAYCGGGDQVNLTLSNNHPSPGENLQYTYTSSAGTLSGNTLLMPDADVTISVDEAHPVALDWATVSEGTQADPYRIYTAEQLNLLAQRVKESESRTNYTGKYFKLMNDIEFSHTTDWDDATSTENNYTPIGEDNMKTFCGDFDGDGHTISGIRIYKPNGENLGLFGCIDYDYSTYGANIHDLTLADTRITGYKSIGGIAGFCDGTDGKGGGIITRCHVAANVAIHAVNREDYPNRQYGGIVGYNLFSTVSHCTSAVTITAEDGCRYFGAISGYNELATLSDNLAIGATVPAGKDNTHGAICGKNSNGVLLRNYYTNSTVAGTANAANVGCYGSDVTASNGAVPAYAITAGEYVTLENTGTIGIMYDDVIYAGSGDEVSLTLGSNHRSFSATGYQASAGTLTGSGNPYTLTMPSDNVVISAASWTSALEGIGTVGNPFLISSDEDWDTFVNYVNSGTVAGFSGEYVKLTHDISVSTMAGTDDAISFQGTFDGDGNTLTFNVNTSAAWTAPFRHVKNAVIKNLHVDGTITTSAQFAAGIVGESHGALTLTGCRSSVAINSSVSGDGTHGGLVSTLSGKDHTIIIDGCVFDGSFATTAGTTNCGGFVGWPVWNRPVIKNSLMKPGSVTASMLNNTFARWHTTYEPTITNCYYVAVDNLPTDQGTQAYAFAIAPVNLGSLTADYDMVKAYANGILYDGMYYVAPTTISLANADDNTTTISGADGYAANVTLFGRTLYKDGKWNTICLPFDVTISGSPLAGAVARPLNSASISGTTLNLTFGDAVDELMAGTPYIIKWESGDDIVSPVFTGVTIDATDRSYDNNASGDAQVRFLGTYKSKTFDASTNSILLMGGENKLYYPLANARIGAQRAYFKIGDGDALARLTGFNIDFGDGDSTQGVTTPLSPARGAGGEAWYTLDGRKLDGKPTAKGIYVNGGRKVIVK